MGFIVMNLWNHVLVDIVHVSPVSFWQALGLFILSKILFSGFRGGGGRWGRHYEWRQKMNQKLANMTPEEKEKFKNDWRARCMGSRFRPERPTEFQEKPAEQ